MATNTDPKADGAAPESAPVNMKMSAQEFVDLRALVAKVQDNAIQPVLREIVNYLGHAYGIDAGEEDKRITKEAQDKADAQAKADEEAQAEQAKIDAEADAQRKRDLFASMFGTSPIPTNTATANAGAVPLSTPDAAPAAKPAPATTTPAPSTPKDAA